uniref:DUF4472 domain-containing protein n=1 Tax=Anabas testudineus TaxID=64144 RepID=A0AAQ6II85_ANATE
MNSQQHQLSSNELQERLQVLQLRDKNEHLFNKVGYLESRLGHLASSNTDLSYRLVQSEEEKLKISKELVEEKIQSNKTREQFEEEVFELKNKVRLSYAENNKKMKLEMKRDKLFRELQSAEARLTVGEKSGQDLTEEHAMLKKKHLALAEAHDKQVAQSEELSSELLALAQAQDTLRKQLQEQQQSVKTATQDFHGELDRVRALISRLSHDKVKVCVCLLGNQDEIKDTLEKMRRSYEEQQKKLEEKVVAMGKEHQENKRVIHNSQQKVSEKSAALMCAQSQVKEVEEENSQLQLHVKKLNEEYRSRLVCYLQDLAEYIDGHNKTPPEGTKLRAFVDSMLQDVKSSYRVREEQLSSAARSYKKRLQKITKTHHALLIAYRVQREQILATPDGGLDPGPPEAHFSLDTSELRDEIEKELQHLRQDKARLEGQLQVARQSESVQQTHEESWMDVRKLLKEITDSTLVGLEKERVLLLTRATVAEAQVLELQDYIDNHLGRYKQEITHLRRLHGIEDAAGRSQSDQSSFH